MRRPINKTFDLVSMTKYAHTNGPSIESEKHWEKLRAVRPKAAARLRMKTRRMRVGQ